MRRLAFALLLCFPAAFARADQITFPGSPPGQLCRQAIETASRAHGMPPGLMAAIGHVESGRRDPAGGAVHPWPWTVDAEGQGAFYDSKTQAIAAVRAFQARGENSIDVGCMQINLMHHPDAFASLEQAFDPMANADYAARFLTELYGQARAWPKATALYHSATPELGAEYQQKVMAAWPEELRIAGSGFPVALAQARGAAFGPVLFSPPRRYGAGARVLPQVAAGGGGGLPSPGRGLNAYRAAPIGLIWRRTHG